MKTKKSEKKISADKVYGVWACPECKREVQWFYSDIADTGNPICGDTNCPEPDTEMEFTGEMGIV